jgi:uncharacterized protein (TIRG00374 family)
MMVDWGEFLVVLLDAQPVLLLAAYLVLLTTRFLTAFKWKLLFNPNQPAPGYGFLLRLVWVSSFLGTFLPTSVGGDAVRVWGLARESQRATDALVSVLLDRLTGVAALLTIAMAGTCMTIGDSLGRLLVPLVLAPGIIISAGLLFMLTKAGSRASQWFTSVLSTRLGFNFPANIDRAIKAYRDFPMRVIAAMALSVLLQMCRVAAVYLVSKSLAVDLSIMNALILVPPVMFIGLLPISIAGIGVVEGALVVFLGFVSIPASAAMAVALVGRILGLAVSLPGGIFFFTSGLQTGRSDE